MSNFSDAFSAALSLIVNFDSGLAEIVALSLQVSLAAVLIASLIGLPLGAALAIFHFPGRTTLVVLLNALMGAKQQCDNFLQEIHNVEPELVSDSSDVDK